MQSLEVIHMMVSNGNSGYFTRYPKMNQITEFVRTSFRSRVVELHFEKTKNSSFRHFRDVGEGSCRCLPMKVIVKLSVYPGNQCKLCRLLFFFEESL